MIGTQRTDLRVWVATAPIDMRKSFDGLAELVRANLQHDPLSGHMFVFRNKGGHLLKILWWDAQGLAIYYKRLERGEFRWPRAGDTSVEITSAQLLHLLSGVEIAERRTS